MPEFKIDSKYTCIESGILAVKDIAIPVHVCSTWQLCHAMGEEGRGGGGGGEGALLDTQSHLSYCTKATFTSLVNYLPPFEQFLCL